MYQNTNDLPEMIRMHLPPNLQEIYLKAYQKSWKNHEDFRDGEAHRQTVAHRNAMTAVEHDHVYHEETSAWYRKGEQPQEEEEQGLLDKLRDEIQQL